MATLTKSTGTVTLTGAVEKVTLPSAYGWVWLKNMSDADMFAGLSADISEGADGVMVIPAGECGRIQTDGFDFVYLMGSGSALVVAQNYADCPFKVGGKGGESPDLSAYAKTADVPNIKVNAAVNADYATNAGNANTVDGLHADDFVNATDKGQIQIPNNVDVPVWISTNGKRFQRYMTNAGNTGLTNVPDNSIDYVWYWYDGLNILARENSSGKYYICDMINGVFSGWKDIYTSGYKPYVTGSISVSYSADSQNFEILNFTPSAVICKYASRYENDGTTIMATPITNGFSLTVNSTEAKSMSYIAFK